MQVDIAEHPGPRGIHLIDVVVLRILVAELIIQHLLITKQSCLCLPLCNKGIVQTCVRESAQ